MLDLHTVDDCRVLVTRFYSAARNDELLGPVFTSRITDAEAWEHHLDTMARFWASILFAEPHYHGRPLDRHVGLPITPAHFDRWVKLWHEAVSATFEGPTADHAKAASLRMRDRLSNALAKRNASSELVAAR